LLNAGVVVAAVLEAMVCGEVEREVVVELTQKRIV
jgi:hypothetical protein